MVKGIFAINNIAKKSVFAAMLAGSVTLGASSPIKNTRQEITPPQTELMSKPAAEALKVKSLQQSPTVPTVHNQKLDDMLLLFYEKDEDKANMKESINQLYEIWGTYAASAMIQTQIDINMFLAYLDGNAEILKRFHNADVVYKSAISGDLEAGKKVKAFVMEWLEPNYSKVFLPVFDKFDHKPTADELISALDSYVEINENKLFKGDYKTSYLWPTERKKETLAKNNSNIIQNNSNLIAYKIHKADAMLFCKLLDAAGIEVLYNKKYKKTFYSGFMQAASP